MARLPARSAPPTSDPEAASSREEAPISAAMPSSQLRLLTPPREVARLLAVSSPLPGPVPFALASARVSLLRCAAPEPESWELALSGARAPLLLLAMGV